VALDHRARPATGSASVKMPWASTAPIVLRHGIGLLSATGSWRHPRSRRGNENPAQGMGIRAPTERGSEIPRGTLGWGVGGTPEGVYEGMPFIGTLQARASR
jgi:hypothetical protein